MAIIKSAIKAEHFTVSSIAPMEIVALDYIEKLTTDARGNKFILVVIDTFSRFIELYPTPSNTAKNTARVLVQHVGRYGSLYVLKSDRGATFINKVINELKSYWELIGRQLWHIPRRRML